MNLVWFLPSLSYQNAHSLDVVGLLSLAPCHTHSLHIE